MTREEIHSTVRQFIVERFLLDPPKTLADDESLLGSGVFDSIGFMTLIAFLEKRFNIEFEERELGAENVDSISRLTDLLTKKLAGTD